MAEPNGEERVEQQPTEAETEDVAAPGNPVQDDPAVAAAVAPSKKETSLREFLDKMDDYAPIVSNRSHTTPSA